MDKRASDLRVRRTRAAIRTAFREMVCTMEADEINVTELTRRANIHRKTFYLHYPTLEALFEETIAELVAGFDRAMEEVNPSLPVDEVTRVFFTYFSNCEPYAERLLCTQSYAGYSDRLFAMSISHSRNRVNPFASYTEQEQGIINAFIMNATLTFYRTWVRERKTMPLENVIPLCCRLISRGTEGVICCQSVVTE